MSDTSGSETADICALSGPFPSPSPLLTPLAASKCCIVHILPHLDLGLPVDCKDYSDKALLGTSFSFDEMLGAGKFRI